ncbi:signal peptidase I [Trueperella sp. LYQ141]|uniref:signal peptidase I n=1 Tax=Trueperella sp. LYQ141 TaxID=3391058 RepID=UPI0039835321
MDQISADEQPDSMPPSYPPQERPERASVAKENADSETKRRKGKLRAWLLELGMSVTLALLISIVIKTFFLQAFEIPSESMESTLIPGDRVMVNKLADDEESLHRGDVVVFVDPGNWLDASDHPQSSGWRAALKGFAEMTGILPKNSGDHLIKRIIGMPGDHVKCCNEVGQITVNDVPITETYVKSGEVPSRTPFDVTVPPDHLWVMGDNRSHSKDSRYHQAASGFGFVPIDHVEGRAWLRILPFDRFGRLPSGTDVFDAVPDAK